MGKDYLKRRDHWNGQLFFMDTKFKLQYDNLFCVSTGHSATVAITWSAFNQLLTGPVFMWPADPLPSQLFTGPVLTSPADQLSVSRSLGQCSRDQLISYQVSCSLAQCSGDQLISYQVSCSLGQCSCDQLISYQSAVHWASVQVTSWSATRSAVHWASVHVTDWSAIRQLFTGPTVCDQLIIQQDMTAHGWHLTSSCEDRFFLVMQWTLAVQNWRSSRWWSGPFSEKRETAATAAVGGRPQGRSAVERAGGAGEKGGLAHEAVRCSTAFHHHWTAYRVVGVRPAYTRNNLC